LKDIKLRLAETEPRLMQMCNSPCLLKCYDVYENEDLKVLILEYCKGKTLQNDIDLKGCIPESSAITIIKHIMIGLMVIILSI
jgi:serine/threonine protein kinase